MKLFSKNFTPHPGQAAFLKGRKRFSALCTGRRWGKTLVNARLIMSEAYHIPDDYGWIGPTYPVTERAIDAFKQLVNPMAYEIKGRPQVATLQNGSRIFFHSADSDDPKSILGHGFRGIVIDEAARVPKPAWDYVIRPTLSDKLGWAVLVSTPKGRNWFFDMWSRGQDEGEKDYAAFNFPSNSNPFFPDQEWEEAKRTLPEMVFRQEYEAEFLDDGAGVFRGIDECLADGVCTCEAPIVLGVDLAKHQDFTVCIAACTRCGRAREMDRFNKIDWPEQKQRIKAMAAKHEALVIIDSTGIGDPIYDDLKRGIRDIKGMKLTNASKAEIIQGLMVAVEQQRISWPRDWDVLTNEMRRYEYEYTSTGLIRYNAPQGYHDDCVIALALANNGFGRWIHPSIGTADDASQSRAINTEMQDLIDAAETPEERAELERISEAIARGDA